MPTTGLSPAAYARFGTLLKAGVSYRTALAIADRVTDDDLAGALAGFSPGGGGGGAVASVAGKTGVVTLVKADVGLGSVDNTADTAKPISTATATALAAKADLVTGKIPTSQLPSVALVSTVPVANQAAMLALTTAQVQPGDVAIRADGAGSFMLGGTGDPSVLGNWTLLSAPTDAVTSVNGHSGTVVLAAADVSADAAGAAAAVQALAMLRANNGSDIVDPAAFRTALGLGTAATSPATAFDAAGAAGAVQTASAPKFLANTYGAAMTGLGVLDQVSGIYRPPGAKLPTWHAKLAAALTGTGIAEVVFIGPSTTMGAPTGISVSPAKKLVGLLAGRGVPVTDGYAPTMSSTSAIGSSSNDSRWTFPDGGWAIFGSAVPWIPTAMSNGGAGKRAIYTSTEKGTIVDLLVMGASGAYTYSIDGAAAVTVPVQANANYSAPVTITGLTYGVHQVVITPTTASLVYLAKARVRNASGVVLNNSGFSGSAAEDWDTTDSTLSGYPAVTFGLPYMAAMGLTSAGLAVIDAALVLNSYFNNTGHTPNYTTALATAALNRLVGQWKTRGYDVILLNSSAPSTTVQFGTYAVVPDATYESYRQVMYSVADTNSCILIDDIERVGLWATSNANGLKADAVHDTAAGYAEKAQALADAIVITPPAVASLSIAPVQRGVWAPNTAYGLNDLVINPSGDLVTPVAPLISGGAYVAAGWNVLVPAPNYGREIAGAEANADFNVNGLTGYQDVPGMTMAVPAGIPFMIDVFGQAASSQGTAAQGQLTGLQARVVDVATSAVVYAFAWMQFEWGSASGSGITQWAPLNFKRRQAALATATSMKLQIQGSATAGQGNIGLFPLTMGGGPPTTMVAIGR